MLRSPAFAAVIALLASLCWGAAPNGSLAPQTVAIPGPLRSFLRMAALSQQTPVPEVLPLLADNVASYGYSLGHPTVHLVLLERYLEQAGELRALAGRAGTLRARCADAKPLLHILGYRIRGRCGAADMELVTANAGRAFLTVDSGFPLPRLDASLRNNGTFVQAYGAIQVPLLFTAEDWARAYPGSHSSELTDAAGPVIEELLRHRPLAQLYAALAAMEAETRDELHRTLGVHGMLPLAAALDFYGAHVVIRSGRVLVPGGAAANGAWRGLAGADPSRPAAFVRRLMSRDQGWLAAYFDDLWRLPAPARAQFAQPRRLRSDYEALRSRLNDRQTMRTAVGYSFRPDTSLLLLLHEAAWQPGGQLLVPGGVAAWRGIWQRQRGSKFLRSWSAEAGRARSPGQVLAALFRLGRLDAADEDAQPLRMFLTLTAIARARPDARAPDAATVSALAAQYARYGDQYETFVEFPDLDSTAMLRYLALATQLDAIPDSTVRGNAVGIFQGEVELWKILARQREIAPPAVETAWLELLRPFFGARTAPELYAAGMTALGRLYGAASGLPPMNENGWVELLAGPPPTNTAGTQVHAALAARLRALLQDQRLVSLDTLQALGMGLATMAGGGAQSAGLMPAARLLRDFDLPRPVLPGRDRVPTGAESLAQRHAALQTHVDLTRLLAARTAPPQLHDAVGELTPFLRDTLVGFCYAYYDPPGGQLLSNDPLFVRLQDFSSNAAVTQATAWQTPALVNRGATGSEGVHLAGSLANLPYVLAQAEEDFLTPDHIQALIWDAVAAGMLTSADVPRWWQVSADELHAVALYQQTGEQVVMRAAGSADQRQQVEGMLADRLLPRRAAEFAQALALGNAPAARALLLPADLFALASRFRQAFPGSLPRWGGAGRDLEELAARDPQAADPARIARDFGVPHPVLRHSYALGLLQGAPLPAVFDYSSRLLGESWDSDNLYWGRLAYQMGYPPAALNLLIPRLTERMVENITASNLQDWPALERALEATGREFLAGKVAGIPPPSALGGRRTLTARPN
ncbi:MAG: hypothetical protein ACRD1C_13755 [Terriglobales bacterium]